MAHGICIVRSCSSAVLSLLLVPAVALAQEWPTKQPIKVVIPLSAGSATDTVGRTVMDQVSKQLKQAIIIENRGGAGGMIGANIVAKAEPDGYTLLVTSSIHTVTPLTRSKVPYDPAKDFAAI